MEQNRVTAANVGHVTLCYMLRLWWWCAASVLTRRRAGYGLREHGRGVAQRWSADPQATCMAQQLSAQLLVSNQVSYMPVPVAVAAPCVLNHIPGSIRACRVARWTAVESPQATEQLQGENTVVLSMRTIQSALAVG